MSGMLNMTNISQFTINSLNQSHFLEQNLVVNMHQVVFHVFACFGNQVYSINKKLFKKCFADISLISNEFSKDLLILLVANEGD